MLKICLTVCIIFFLRNSAEAYIDPGTGGVIVGSLSALFAALLGFLGSGFLIFRRFVKRLYGNKTLFYLLLAAFLTILFVGLYNLNY